MDDMLSIGEFSAQSGLSAKMLRSYAGSGLLVPAAVDPSSGYRYYSTAQLREARLVALLRQARVPVAEIASFLRDPKPETVDLWERSIDLELRSRRQALADVRERLGFARMPVAAPARDGGGHMPHVVWGSATGVGRVRTSNEDAVRAANHLFAVADGMGGGGRGEVASAVALETLNAGFVHEPTHDGLIEGAREANRAVWRRAEDDAALAGMGTTLTAAALVSDDDWRTLAVVNIGDSRAYILEEGQLRRVTRDHSVVEELVLAGALTEDKARTHPQRSILTRALGVGPEVEPDSYRVTPTEGDRLLLCTDGLFNEIDEEAIADALRWGAGPPEVAEDLVRRANEAGGRDNVTVVVVDFV